MGSNSAAVRRRHNRLLNHERYKNTMNSPSLPRGICLMTISWILFAVMNAVAKYACGYTAFTVVLFFQHGIAFLLLSPLLFSSGFSLLDTENKGLLGLRALGGLLVFICLFFALSLIPLTDALLLANTGPLFLFRKWG